MTPSNTAIIESIWTQDLEALNAALAMGGDPNYLDDGVFPLCLAADINFLAGVNTLIDSGALYPPPDFFPERDTSFTPGHSDPVRRAIELEDALMLDALLGIPNAMQTISVVHGHAWGAAMEKLQEGDSSYFSRLCKELVKFQFGSSYTESQLCALNDGLDRLITSLNFIANSEVKPPVFTPRLRSPSVIQNEAIQQIGFYFDNCQSNEPPAADMGTILESTLARHIQVTVHRLDLSTINLVELTGVIRWDRDHMYESTRGSLFFSPDPCAVSDFLQLRPPTPDMVRFMTAINKDDHIEATRLLAKFPVLAGLDWYHSDLGDFTLNAGARKCLNSMIEMSDFARAEFLDRAGEITQDSALVTALLKIRKNPNIYEAIAYDLIRHGANVNLTDRRHITPLFKAVHLERGNLCYELLSAGADEECLSEDKNEGVFDLSPRSLEIFKAAKAKSEVTNLLSRQLNLSAKHTI